MKEATSPTELDYVYAIKNKYRLNIELASFAKGNIPKYILLDKTRNIHSYLVFASIVNNHIVGDYFGNGGDFKNFILELLRLQYSTLDRPVFLIVDVESEMKIIECNVIREFLINEPNLLKGINGLISDELDILDDVISRIKAEL
jgi:hypothetical protein